MRTARRAVGVSLASGAAFAALGLSCAPAAASATAGPLSASTGAPAYTYQVYVGKTLVTSSANPAQHVQPPTYVETVGEAVTVSVTYVTNFPITLETRTIYSYALTAVPEVPQGVTATITAADCAPIKTGETAALQCETLPAGTNTVNFTYLVMPGSAFLKEPLEDGAHYITQTVIPKETATQLDAGADFSVLVETPDSSTAGSAGTTAPTGTPTATPTASRPGVPTATVKPPVGSVRQGPADVAPLVAAAVANSSPSPAASPPAGQGVFADPPDIFTSGTEPAAAATAGVILLLALGGSLIWRRRVYTPELEGASEAMAADDADDVDDDSDDDA